MTSVTVRVPAKVNLQLSVGPVRDDGYHDLVNVFQAVSLFDEVTAAPAEDLTVAVEDAGSAERGVPVDGVPDGRDNLAARAAYALAEHAGVEPAVALRIRKAIPVAGGMAGGSADAAAALLACDRLWDTGTGQDTLLELAATLGSDVPFALMGGTAVGLGRGELLTPAMTRGRFHWVFAGAENGLSTPAVYAECDRLRDARGEEVDAPRLSEPLMAALAAGYPEALGAALLNELQPAALSLRPSLEETLIVGRKAGALGTLVSGSGPTCAFLTDTEERAMDLADALSASGACAFTVRAYGPVPGATVI